MKKVILLILILTFSLVSLNTLNAQEEDTSGATSDLSEFTAESLDIKEPTILPTNKFGYFFKNVGQVIRSAVTFDPEKKADLNLKYANEKIFELKKITENESDDPKIQELIKKHHVKYNKLMDKVSTRIEKIKENNGDEAVDELLDRVTDNQFKHQDFFANLHKKLENALSGEEIDKLKEEKKKALEHYGNLIERVDVDNSKERLQKIMKEQAKNKLQYINHLKVMEELGDTFENENFKEDFLETKIEIRERLVNYLDENASDEVMMEFKLKLENLETDDGYKLRVYNFVDDKIQEARVNNWKLNEFHNDLDELKINGIEALKIKLENISDEEKEKIFRTFESSELNSVRTLEQVKARLKNPEAIEAVEASRLRQMDHFNDRIENISDHEKIEELKHEINNDYRLKNDIEDHNDEIMDKLEDLIKVRKKHDEKIKKSLEELED